MGAAIEGSFYGIPAVGLSLTDHSPDADFMACKEYGRLIVRSILENQRDEDHGPLCLNVNVPDIDPKDIKGIRICRQCRGIWREEFFPHQTPNGRRYFWLTGAFNNYEPEAEQTDEWALSNGYVAVVPVQIDMTAYAYMPYLERILK
jgi:5'-nucleotidase